MLKRISLKDLFKYVNTATQGIVDYVLVLLEKWDHLHCYFGKNKELGRWNVRAKVKLVEEYKEDMECREKELKDLYESFTYQEKKELSDMIESITGKRKENLHV